MDSYSIEPEGNGFQVTKISPDGRVWLIGIFLTKASAQLWVDDQKQMIKGRELWPRRFANHGERISV